VLRDSAIAATTNTDTTTTSEFSDDDDDEEEEEFASFDLEATIAAATETPDTLNCHSNLSKEIVSPQCRRRCGDCRRMYYESEWDSVDQLKFYVIKAKDKKDNVSYYCPVCQGASFSQQG
jgi:hypothetical protein